MLIEMSQNVHQPCFELAEQMRQLFDEFQERCLKLVVQHCEKHIPNESQITEAHGIRGRKPDPIPQNTKSSQLLKCPKCRFVSDRRNNLERHWPSHIPCNERCKFCDRSLSHVQHYIYHHKKCTVKDQFSNESTEQVEALQQLDEFQEIATTTLDESLQSSGNKRKRTKLASGSASKRARHWEFGVNSTLTTGHNLNIDPLIGTF
ncbi:hypothetical protein F5B17DRAFT_422563 [Nemania serpens]|nr:hypothetical protein F5B17DRAFT_422563 [Nemania serpens]